MLQYVKITIFLIFLTLFISSQSLLSNDSIFINDIEKRIELYCAKAERSSDTDTILNYSTKAFTLAEDIGYEKARILVLEGNGYLQSGDLSKALKCFTRAVNYYYTEKNENGVASAYMYIANVFYSQQNIKNFNCYLKKAIVILSEQNDSIRLASAIHNLGHGLYKEKQYDSALCCLNEAQIIYEKLSDKEGMAYCLGSKGMVLSRMNRLDEASVLLLNAIEMLNNFEDQYAVTDYMVEYANILQQKGKINEAIEYAINSYYISDRLKLIESKRDAAYCLSKLFGKISAYDSAFYYQSMYILLNDSIKNIEAVQKIADLRTEFEIEQKQKEVDILNRKKSTQLLIIAGLIIILLLASGLIFLYYSSLRKARKFTVVLEERKKLLEKQSKELKELNKIKDKFFSVISHDLRGPISSIGGISTLLKESNLSSNPQTMNELADYIDQTVVSLSGLLENLLNWAQSEQGKMPYKPEKINTQEIVEEVVKLFATISISKNISVHLHLNPELYIIADRNSMMVILRNLLSNAIKFTPAGGDVFIRSWETENNAILQIEDNGVGISPEKIPGLFELKEVKSTWGTHNEKGFGLGLTLVNEFVRLNKGIVDVQSIIKEGTTFTIEFPRFE